MGVEVQRGASSTQAVRVLKALLGLGLVSAVIALVLWSSAIVTRFLSPLSYEAEEQSQPPLSYRILQKPLVLNVSQQFSKRLERLARGRYELSVRCSAEGRGAGNLLALVDGLKVGEVLVSSSSQRVFTCPVEVSASAIELGLKFEPRGACSLRVEQIKLERATPLTYREATDRYGLPRGRRIDFQNPLTVHLEVPRDAYGLLVRAKADQLSAKPPKIAVLANGETLGSHTVYWVKWSDYIFGLRGLGGKAADLTIRVANANGVAIIDRITLLQRRKIRAYALDVLGTFLEACSAQRAAAKCYLASLRFYPENWRAKNNLLRTLLLLDMPDEAAVMLHLFRDFQPKFSDSQVRADQVSSAATTLVDYGDPGRAESLVDRYFRTYGGRATRSLLRQILRKTREMRKLTMVSPRTWTLIPASALSVAVAPALTEGRETSVLEGALSGRRGANVLLRRREETHLLDQVYDVPSGILSPNFVLADPCNAKNLLSGWDRPANARIVWGTGTESVLAVSLERPNDLLLTFRVKPRLVYNLLPQMVVSFNGKRLREIKLLPGWHEYQTFVPAELQRAGQNRLSMSYKYFGPDVRGEGGEIDRKVAFHYIEWWPTDERFKDRFIYETGTMVGNHRFDIDGDVRQTLFVHPPRAIFYPVIVWPDTTLSFGLGISEKIWDRGGDGVLFEVHFYPQNRVGEKARPVILLSRFLNACGNPGDRHWFDYKLDLGNSVATVGTLAFETLPGKNGDFWYDWSGFSDPVTRETVEYIDLSRKSCSAWIKCVGGEYNVAVLAKGSPVDVFPPWLGVMIDGHYIQMLLIKHPEWAPYWLKVRLPAGQHTLTLYFANETDVAQSWKPMRLLIGGVGLKRAS